MTNFEQFFCMIVYVLSLGWLGYMVTEIIKDAVDYAHAKEEESKEKLKNLRFTCMLVFINLFFVINVAVLSYHAMLNK